MKRSVLIYTDVGDDYGRVEYVQHMGSDQTIIDAARVSFSRDLEGGALDEIGIPMSRWRPEKDPQLLRYLLRHQHWSPFEHCAITWHIVVPLFVRGQWHRHRTWCLASDTELEFARPDNGRSYRVRVDRLEAAWNPPEAKRRRKDQSPLSLQEHNRKRIQNMQLRCRGANGEVETTRITDVWKSGTKKVYEVRAGQHRIRASADHLFHSEGEWVPVSRLEGRNVTLIGRAGSPRALPEPPVFTDSELEAEQWVEMDIDDDPLNNRAENLYRGDAKDNMDDQERNGGRQRRAWVSVPVDEIVECGEEPVYDVSVEHPEHCFVANKFLVHNCYNEVSRRYTSENLFFYEPGEFRPQAKKNKQASDWAQAINPKVYSEVEDLDMVASYAIASQREQAVRLYQALLDAGIAREQARMVLPQNMYVRFYGTTNLRNALAFIKLREDNHSQWEIFQAAKAMRHHLEHLFPEALKAWEEVQKEK